MSAAAPSTPECALSKACWYPGVSSPFAFLRRGILVVRTMFRKRSLNQAAVSQESLSRTTSVDWAHSEREDGFPLRTANDARQRRSRSFAHFQSLVRQQLHERIHQALHVVFFNHVELMEEEHWAP